MRAPDVLPFPAGGALDLMYALIIATGLLGFVWLAFWLTMYKTPEEHPRLSREELAFIRSDPPEPPARTLAQWAIDHRADFGG